MSSITKRVMNNKRFSHEQIKQLESIFESEPRPEHQMKQQLANEIGLHPHQVSIWFQNKRARSKSKQTEGHYSMLQNRYNALASRFDSLMKENQCLLIQLQSLRSLMEKPHGSKKCKFEQTGERSNEEHENTNTNSNCEAVENPNLQLQSNNHEIGMPFCDDSESLDYFGEETDVLNLAEQPDGSLTSSSSGHQCSLDSSFEFSCLLDHSTSSSQWWDIYS